MLEEDEGFGDITSEAVVDEDKTVTAHIISKDEGILAGIDIIKEMFESKNVQVIFNLKDGTKIPTGELMLCSNTDCKYNVNGRCWNSNYSYDCNYRIKKEV